MLDTLFQTFKMFIYLLRVNVISIKIFIYFKFWCFCPSWLRKRANKFCSSWDSSVFFENICNALCSTNKTIFKCLPTAFDQKKSMLWIFCFGKSNGNQRIAYLVHNNLGYRPIKPNNYPKGPSKQECNWLSYLFNWDIFSEIVSLNCVG